jgi:undecaprenyl-diphosphatase
MPEDTGRAVTRDPAPWLARLAEWDRWIASRIALLVRAPVGWWTAWLLARSGDSYWWLAGGLFLWWRGDDFWRGFGLRILVVTLAAGLASGILKWLFRRGRPEGGTVLPLFALDRHSFPSGHATRTAGLVVVLGAMVAFPWTFVLALWTLFVGVSRVALSAHHASDIVAGWILGASLGGLLLVGGFIR